MSDRKGFADDYITVAERIAAFHEKHPEGSLQSEILTLDAGMVLVKAWAYRTPDDARPGIGHASETIPGSTPYTRGSELENAETSAWGRAIAALGFEVKAGVATAEDVRRAQVPQPAQEAPQRTAPRPQESQPKPAPSAPQRASTAPVQNLQPMTMRDAMEALEGVDKRTISDTGKKLFGTWSLKEMTPEQRAHLVAELRDPQPGPDHAKAPAADDEDWGALLDKAPAA